MKKLNDIYSRIISRENLYRSAYMAARSRRYMEKVADFNFRLEEEVEALRRELADRTYKHGKYRVFNVYDPKERKIAAAPFRDRVVHHAVNDVIEPLIDRTFIYDSYACRKGKGTHKALDRAQRFLRLNRLCLHADVRKFFPSIDHGILKRMLAERIMDEPLLRLTSGIVDSARQLSGGGNLETMAKGLPIGNLTSQFFANLYLNELDYFVKFRLRERHYIRYMDDFLIFSNDKKALIEVKERAREFLNERLALQMHEGKSQIYNTRNGIKFLGFRLYKDHRRLASDNVRRFKKRLKKFGYLLGSGQVKKSKVRDSVRCWAAHSSYADTGGLRLNIFNALAEKDSCLAGLLKNVLLQREKSAERSA